MLTEGERQDEIEVREIDEHAGAVKLSYAGTELMVNFKDNAVASAAPAPPVPGAPPVPAAKPGTPVPAQPQAGGNSSLPTPIPPRSVRAAIPTLPQIDPAAGGVEGRIPGFDEHGL